MHDTMMTFVKAGKLDRELNALGVNPKDLTTPKLSLRTCITEMNDRLTDSHYGTGSMSREMLISLRHYLAQLAVMYKVQ